MRDTLRTHNQILDKLWREMVKEQSGMELVQHEGNERLPASGTRAWMTLIGVGAVACRRA